MKKKKKKQNKNKNKKKRSLKGISCGEKFARLAGICLCKELSRQVRDFLLFLKRRGKVFPLTEEIFTI